MLGGLPKDVWKYEIEPLLSPLTLARMCLVSRGFHQIFKDNKDLKAWQKNERPLDRKMSEAAEGGHKDLVDFFISKGANYWNWGLLGAAKGGNKDLLDFFISNGANDWNCGLFGAAKGGHKDLVDFFEKKLKE